MRGGLPLVLGTGIRRGVSTGTAAKRLVIDLPFSSGVQLHPDLAARGPPRARTPTRGSTGSPTPARRGGRCCRSGPPDRHRSPYKAASAFAAWPGLLAEPRAPVTQGARSSTSASARATGSRTGRASARAARSPTRCASTASGPRCGAYAARARRAASSATSRSTSRPGSADHRAHPELFQRGRRGRHAARRLHRQGPAVGQPALRLAGDAAPRLPLVGRAAAAHVRRSSTSRASTTSAASSPTGRCPARRRARAAAGAGSAGRGARCSTPRRARSSASCR